MGLNRQDGTEHPKLGRTVERHAPARHGIGVDAETKTKTAESGCIGTATIPTLYGLRLNRRASAEQPRDGKANALFDVLSQNSIRSNFLFSRTCSARVAMTSLHLSTFYPSRFQTISWSGVEHVPLQLSVCQLFQRLAMQRAPDHEAV